MLGNHTILRHCSNNENVEEQYNYFFFVSPFSKLAEAYLNSIVDEDQIAESVRSAGNSLAVAESVRSAGNSLAIALVTGGTRQQGN